MYEGYKEMEIALKRDMVGIIDAGFDQSGECIKFSLPEMHPAKKKVM